MESDPSIVDITTSFRLLYFHGVTVPLQIPIYPIIDVILVNDMKGKWGHIQMRIGSHPTSVLLRIGDQTEDRT